MRRGKEKRNLGVTCYEIEFSDDDKISDIESNRDKFFERQYVVFKVPNTRADISAYVQSQGAKFIEAQLTLTRNLRNWKVPEFIKDIFDNVSYAPMNDADIEFMFNEIRKGIFRTDRIYLDPYFTYEQAATRYVNWTRDSINCGKVPYKVIYNDEPVGFFSENLVGVYSKFSGSGMGMLVAYCDIQKIYDEGKRNVDATVSVNNPEIINAWFKFGYLVKTVKNVFIIHND